jgi:ectoine hydroxylase-related dioxygenase (phytanoyl-CoA dioxygenase family)
MNPQSVAEALNQSGYAVVPPVLSPAEIEALLAAVSRHEGSGVRHKGERAVYAIRNLLEVEAVRDLVAHPAIQSLTGAILGPGAFAVRGILFDKTPEANWKVVWHQDLSIAVQEKREVSGFGPWSVKAGVVHVQPPVAVLERMATIRLHLDDCGLDNGALKVLPGSHAMGRLVAEEIERCRQETAEVLCPVPAGGALVMRPLILHASAPATSPRHRRVVHLEFATEELPGGLGWYDRVSA